MEEQHKTCALGELAIDVEVALHLQCHLLADRQSKTVTLSKVFYLGKWLEHLVALLLGDTLA